MFFQPPFLSYYDIRMSKNMQWIFFIYLVWGKKLSWKRNILGKRLAFFPSQILDAGLKGPFVEHWTVLLYFLQNLFQTLRAFDLYKVLTSEEREEASRNLNNTSFRAASYYHIKGTVAPDLIGLKVIKLDTRPCWVLIRIADSYNIFKSHLHFYTLNYVLPAVLQNMIWVE